LDFRFPYQSPWPVAGGFVQVRAHAKINLYLDVLGKRTNGYHDIISVMQSLDLCDELTICKGEGFNGVKLVCNDPTLPTDESNLIVKAANLLIREYHINQPIYIELTKKIPVGAGLAGGSSDCAATLKGINTLFELDIPLRKILQFGGTLGADVPFCIMGGTALAEGIGEILTPLPAHPSCYILLVCPNIHVSTADVYNRLDAVKNRSIGQDKLNRMTTGLKTKDIQGISRALFNTFTQVTTQMHPEISQIIHALESFGALGAAMSGTGSAVFAYFEDKNKAQVAYDKFKNEKKSTYLTYPEGNELT